MKKIFIQILSLALVVSLFASCKVTPTPKATPTLDANTLEETTEPTDKITSIKVTSGLWTTPEEQEYIKEVLLPRFKEESGISVNLEIMDGEQIIKSVEAQKTKDEWKTDIFVTHTSDMPTFIMSGYVQPIESVLSTLNITILDAFNEAISHSDNTYYIPISADVYLLVFNNKAIDYLPADTAIDSITWEQYKNWALAIRKETHKAKVIMPAAALTSMIYQIGGIALSYGADFPEVNTHSVEKALTLIGEMIKHDTIVSSSFEYATAYELMTTEKAWLSFAHMIQAEKIYASSPEDYTVVSAPMGTLGTGSIASAWGIGISTGTTKLAGAEKFIEFITRPDILYDISANTGGYIPPIEEVLPMLGSSPMDVVIREGIYTLQSNVTHSVPSSLYTDWVAIKTIYDDIFAKLWADAGIVDSTYLDEKQEELDSLLK